MELLTVETSEQRNKPWRCLKKLLNGINMLWKQSNKPWRRNKWNCTTKHNSESKIDFDQARFKICVFEISMSIKIQEFSQQILMSIKVQDFPELSMSPAPSSPAAR